MKRLTDGEISLYERGIPDHAKTREFIERLKADREAIREQLDRSEHAIKELYQAHLEALAVCHATGEFLAGSISKRQLRELHRTHAEKHP